MNRLPKAFPVQAATTGKALAVGEDITTDKALTVGRDISALDAILDASPPKLTLIAHENITERKRLEVALQTMATTDDLTGLANRRHFLARLAEEQARLQRQNTHRAVVLMLDLDYFKAVNDTFGHAAGDRAL